MYGAALRLAMIGGHSRTALFLSEWTRERRSRGGPSMQMTSLSEVIRQYQGV
jgi:hypothetical protein